MNNFYTKNIGKTLESDMFKKPKEVEDYTKSILAQDKPNKAVENKDTSSENNERKHLPAGGTWEGEKGNSVWIPNSDTIPDLENRKGGNPDGKTWGEILEKYGIKGIEFKDGEPDFSPVSKSEVKIDDFTSDRTRNFQKADIACAEKWNKEGKDGKTDWTPRDIMNYRKDRGYTWHECSDCKTMQLVPKEIHNNTPHSGGISEIKKQNSQ